MKDLKIYLGVAAVLLVLYIVVQYNKPQVTDWRPNYNNTKKSPFGTLILFERIRDMFPQAKLTPHRQPVERVLANNRYNKSTYIIIANRIQPSEQDYNALVNYAKAGNDVFIAAEDMGTVFSEKLNTRANDYMGEYNKTEYVSFVNPALDPERQYYLDKAGVESHFTQLDTAKAIVLGQNNNGLANFIQYKMGKGAIYLSTNPKLFTNYGLLKQQSGGYAPTALSYLNNPNEVIWDEYYSQGSATEASPMRVFFNNPYLKWAYYIGLISLLVYVIYGIKRRQRPIPVIEPLSNTTLDFVNVVGRVYYEQRDNTDITHKKVLYFLSYLRDRYRLKTNKLDQEFINELSQKTGLEKKQCRELVNYINYIALQERVSDHELLELNKLIEDFQTISA